MLVRYYIGFTVKYRVRPGRNGTQGLGGNGLQTFLRRWTETFLWRGRLAGNCYRRWLIRGRTDFHGWGLKGWSLWAYHNRGANSARHGIFSGRSTPRGPKRLYIEIGVLGLGYVSIIIMLWQVNPRGRNKFVGVFNMSYASLYLRVLGRILFALWTLVPSKIFNAVRSSGEICLNNGLVFLAGDVNDFIFSFSISRRIFSFRLRRSSSFQSLILRGRDGSKIK